MLFPWIKRPDLIAVPYDAGGWVVKDPLTLQYAFLNETEYSILELLDGRVTLQSLLLQVEKLSPRDAISADDLGFFVKSLAGHQLIRQMQSGDSLRLTGSSAQPLWQRTLQRSLQILRVQVPLLNPSRILTSAVPLVGKLVNPAAIRALRLLLIAAAVVALLQFHELRASLPTMQEFLGPQNIVLMLLVFVGVKVLHETGHALTARYFGAECNEVGVMLIVFTPVLYTNVTDAWMLSRRERMLITAAGIGVELVIAAICLLLWRLSSPGLTNSVLLNTILLCSVNTILFNGNPLLRFDGYFLLADLLRIPNLASRSSTAVQQMTIGLVLGQRQESIETRKTHAILLVYGVLSMAYRVFLTLAILRLVRHMAEQWNMQLLGSLLTLVILSGFLVIPLFRFLQQLFDAAVMMENNSKAWVRIGTLGVLLLGALCIPLPKSVIAPAYIQPTSAPVYAVLGGNLQPISVYGSKVASGETLAVLHNPDLLRTGQRLAGRVLELEAQRDALTLNPETATSELIPTIEESLRGAVQQKLKFESESRRLRITSPGVGTFFPPPSVSRERRIDLTEFWDGTAVTVRNTGAWMERGTLLGYVGTSRDVEVLACVSEDDVAFLVEGQTVKFLPVAGAAAAAEGVVREVATLESKTIPGNLATSGLVNGRSTERGIEPVDVTYIVTVQLRDLETSFSPALYSVGHVRIGTESTSIYRRIQRYLRQTF